MKLELPTENKIKIKQMLENLLNKRVIKIQCLAETIGTIVTACPAVAYGWLYYKPLEKIKLEA